MGKRDWENWLEHANRGTVFESRGSFALDLAAAARTFGQYALQDPLEILARLIRVGVLCGHDDPVEIELMRERAQVKIPGNASSIEALSQVFSQVLSPDPAEREFSVALNSLAASAYREFSVLRAQPSRVAVLTSQRPGDFQVMEAIDLNQERFFSVVSWTAGWSRSLSERLDWVRQAFRFCPQPLMLNGQPLQQPFGRTKETGMVRNPLGPRQVLYKPAWYRLASYVPADHHALEFRVYHPTPQRNEVHADWPGPASGRVYVGQPATHYERCFMLFGLACDPERASRVDWVYRGQIVASEEMQLPLPGLVGALACEGLAMDLTGSRPIQSASLRARQQFVRDWLEVLADFLDELFQPGNSLPLAHRILNDRLLRGEPHRLPHTARVKELLARMRL